MLSGMPLRHTKVRMDRCFNVFLRMVYWLTIRMSHYMENTMYTRTSTARWSNSGGIPCSWAAGAFLLVLAGAACAGADGVDARIQPTLRESIDESRGRLTERLFGLELSAFGDVASQYDDAGRQKLDWGAFELDATTSLSHDLQAALAVVTDQISTSTPVWFFDYHTFGGRIAPRGRLWVEKGFHVQYGRFDVPFGNDWQFFASKDSVSISRPLTTELVMEGGYNDKGMRLLGNNGSINFNAFLLRGFNRGRLAGGRIGLTPFSDPFSLVNAREPRTFELGLSYLYDAVSGWKKSETAFAVDSEVYVDDWSARFEYLVRKREPMLGADISKMRGWHFTQEYLFDEDDTHAWPTTVFLRYEQETMEPPEIATLGMDAGNAYDVRVATGLKTNLGGSDVFQLKFELQHYREATPATRARPGFGRKLFWFTQLVVVL